MAKNTVVESPEAEKNGGNNKFRVRQVPFKYTTLGYDESTYTIQIICMQWVISIVPTYHQQNDFSFQSYGGVKVIQGSIHPKSTKYTH